MRRIYGLLTIIMLAVFPFLAMAHEYMTGDLMIGHPWTRATAGTAVNGSIYLTLSNEGTMTERLLAASTPMAEKAELHIHLMENGVMKMRQVDRIDIGPGAMVELKPGGLHIMLMGLTGPLVEGTRFPLTLTFETSGNIAVEVVVEGAGASEPPHEGHHMH